MSNKKNLFRWHALTGATTLALMLTACGGGGGSGSSDIFCAPAGCVTNFSDAVYQNGLALSGGALDLSSGTETERRMGIFLTSTTTPPAGNGGACLTAGQAVACCNMKPGCNGLK